jgi:hypothetical protein
MPHHFTGMQFFYSKKHDAILPELLKKRFL